MDHQRSGKKGGNGLLVASGIVFVVLSGVLLEDAYIRRLMKDLAADSAGVGVSVLTVAWWCLAAWLAATLLGRMSHRFLFPFDDQPKRRKILSDLLSGLIYLGAFFGILQYAFHKPLTGLLATSGILALVLGLALQSTLADLFSGIALDIEGPFRAGDWITVDGTNEGQVIEINWRATRLRDRIGDITIIPNSQIAKSRLTNHCLPEKAHSSSIGVDFEAESSMVEVEEALISAALKAKYVLSDPPPEVTVEGIRGRTASYCVSFYVGDFPNIPLAQSNVRKQVLASVSNADPHLVLPQTEVLVVQK